MHEFSSPVQNGAHSPVSPELGLVTGKPRKPRFGNLALVYSGAAVAAEWLDAVHPVFAAFAVLQR